MSETQTLTISEFLKARLNELQSIAENADGESYFLDDGEYTGRLLEAQPAAFVLEDIMSKRAIVDLHKQHPFEHGICDTCPELYPCTTLRLLAAPYRRHEDYQEAWA